MAVLEKIRVKMGLFITVVIGLALLSFIIDADTLQTAVSMFSSKYDVGEANGKAISYQDFQKRVDYFTKIHQLMTGSASLDEQSSEMVNQSAWQDIISDKVLMPSIESTGISVGEEELLDLTQGRFISQVLTREQAFIGENGEFDRNLLVQFVRAIPQDPSGNLSMYWDYLEKNIVVDQMVGKYVTLLSKSNIQNLIQLRRSIEDNNITSDVSFVVQPFGFAEDTSVVVSKQEIRDYYNRHKHNFEQPAGRDIEYVVFEVTPSLRDIELAQNEMESVMDEFATTTNLRSFLARNSDRQLDNFYYKQSDLESFSDEIANFVFSSPVGSVMPIVRDGNTFISARVNSFKDLPDSVFLQHILLQSTADNSNKKLADSLVTVIDRGANFNELAAEYSLDRNPNSIPGELGWMTQQNMVPGFDTCFVARVGKPFVIETNYGIHIINVKERTKPNRKAQVAILEKSAIAGRETFQGFYSQANEFATKVDGKLSNFNQLSMEMGLHPTPAYNLAQNARSIAAYPNAREIVRWAYDANKGDASQIISLDNKYFFVVALTGVREAGIPKLEQVESQIASLLRREKSNEKALMQVKERVSGINDIELVAEKLGTTVSKQSGISFGAQGAQSFDPKFIGFVAGAAEGKLMGPVAGNVGIYIFNVNSRDIGAFFTEDDAISRHNQVSGFQMQMIPTILEKKAGVKDYRARFF